MRFLLVLVPVLTSGAAAFAEPDAPPATGLYETWSAVLARPVGPLAAPPPYLPRWLDVTTSGDASAIVFRPEGRVVWRVRWSDGRLIEKEVLVDGEPWTRSRLERDARGRLVGKIVDGPGAPGGPWRWRYRTDSTGRVILRTGELALRMPWHSRNLPAGRAAEEWRVRWTTRGARARLFVDGVEVRRDDFDPSGRPLRTELVRAALAIVYRRDRHGALVGIDRVRDGHTAPARIGVRDPSVSGQHLAALMQSVVERHEVDLLLGAPATASDDARGAERRVTETWSPDCWLNQPSAAEFDAAGLLVSTVVTCICGYCVDAALPVEAQGVLGVDLHWTAGPWIRLDDAVDVTADHGVWTPRGIVPAGRLRPGDTVLAADGTTRRLRSVVVLPAGPERLGRNVRTRFGFFAAGGIRFASEPPRTCQ